MDASTQVGCIIIIEIYIQTTKHYFFAYIYNISYVYIATTLKGNQFQNKSHLIQALPFSILAAACDEENVVCEHHLASCGEDTPTWSSLRLSSLTFILPPPTAATPPPPSCMTLLCVDASLTYSSA